MCGPNRPNVRYLSLILFLILTGAVPVIAQPAPATAPADRPVVSRFLGPHWPTTAPACFSKASAARPEPQPPSYARSLDKLHPVLKDFDWLDFGLEHRTRFEYRDDDYRRTAFGNDDQYLLRSRGYLGVRKILDPFRLGFEFQDTRQFDGETLPETGNEVNENDVVQLFGEIFLPDAAGEGESIHFRFGRLTLDLMDRKLVCRPRWRNTVNSFDGFQVQMGEQDSEWELNIFAVQPTERRVRQPDRPDEERWFYGINAAWRSYPEFLILEPYYLILDEDRKDRDLPDREIHTLGLHGFATLGRSGFDYDFNVAFQFGDDGDREHRAFASFAELGYTFEHPWQPRLSASAIYSTGDPNPADGLSEPFDRLFGVAHQYSMNDYIFWQNVIGPRIGLEFAPLKPLRIDANYRAFWLARDEDAWITVNRRDPAGRSGDFLGQEIDLRARYRLDPRVELEVGYAHFIPGEFVQNTGPSPDSDFFYVQTILQPYQ